MKYKYKILLNLRICLLAFISLMILETVYSQDSGDRGGSALNITYEVEGHRVNQNVVFTDATYDNVHEFISTSTFGDIDHFAIYTNNDFINSESSELRQGSLQLQQQASQLESTLKQRHPSTPVEVVNFDGIHPQSDQGALPAVKPVFEKPFKHEWRIGFTTFLYRGTWTSVIVFSTMNVPMEIAAAAGILQGMLSGLSATFGRTLNNIYIRDYGKTRKLGGEQEVKWWVELPRRSLYDLVAKSLVKAIPHGVTALSNPIFYTGILTNIAAGGWISSLYYRSVKKNIQNRSPETVSRLGFYLMLTLTPLGIADAIQGEAIPSLFTTQYIDFKVTTLAILVINTGLWAAVARTPDAVINVVENVRNYLKGIETKVIKGTMSLKKELTRFCSGHLL